MKKKFIIWFVIAIQTAAFSKGFDQKIFAPFIGVSGGVTAFESEVKGKMYADQTMVGPSLGLDMFFNMKKNGFTFMFNNNIMPVFIERHSDPYAVENKRILRGGMGFGILWYAEFLFGYTYGIGEKFELTAAAGPAFLLPVYPALNLRVSTAYYFNRKYGIYLGLGNSFYVFNMRGFGVDKSSWILGDIISFSIGPVFRLN